MAYLFNLYTWELNFGQTIWDKREVLLGTIWGTPWELGEPPWEHDENTLRTHDLRLVWKQLPLQTWYWNYYNTRLADIPSNPYGVGYFFTFVVSSMTIMYKIIIIIIIIIILLLLCDVYCDIYYNSSVNFGNWVMTHILHWLCPYIASVWCPGAICLYSSLPPKYAPV